MEEFRVGALLAEFFSVNSLIESVLGENSQAEKRNEVIAALEGLNQKCRESILPFSQMAIDQLIGAIRRGVDPVPYDAREIGMIRQRIVDELTKSRFMQIAPAKISFYAMPDQLFGQVTAAKFSKIGYDIEEAGKCFASGRNTGCVFHLMRVMEFGVQKFGQRLKVTLVGEKRWQVILDQVNARIKTLPEKTSRQKKRKSEFAEIASHLFNVKIAWRNEVMHPKESYNDEEAEEIFSHVKSFMRHLAQKL